LIAIANEFLYSSESDSESDAEIDDELLLDANYSFLLLLGYVFAVLEKGNTSLVQNSVQDGVHW